MTTERRLTAAACRRALYGRDDRHTAPLYQVADFLPALSRTPCALHIERGQLFYVCPAAEGAALAAQDYGAQIRARRDAFEDFGEALKHPARQGITAGGPVQTHLSQPIPQFKVNHKSSDK
jgi:hypothetical protein